MENKEMVKKREYIDRRKRNSGRSKGAHIRNAHGSSNDMEDITPRNVRNSL